MAQPIVAALPPDLNLQAGYVIRVNALDPTTGAEVTGVTVTDFAIYCDNLTGADLGAGAFVLVPGPGA